MARRRIAAAIVTAIGATACNAILGIDPPIVADDASDGDAGTGGDAGSPVAGNVLQNSDFENGSCDGWVGNSASLTIASISHGGGRYSCLVCQTVASSSVYTISQNIDVTKVNPGTTYLLQAWVRLPAPDSGLSSATSLLIGIDVPNGLDEQPASSVSSDTWSLVSETAPFQPLDADIPTISILNRSNDDGCFLVDDFTMSPQN